MTRLVIILSECTGSIGMKEIKCNCGNSWFRTLCLHHDGDTGTVCTKCNQKIYIDWQHSVIIEERNKD